MQKLSHQGPLKILVSFRHFPVAMGRFFHWAFQDLGHEVFTVGPYSHGHIPWGDYYFPDYKFAPDFALPEENMDVNDVLKRIPFKPDVIFQAADTIYLRGRPPVPNVILGTDPHAIDYMVRLLNADFFFCMQKYYMIGNRSRWIPYAYYPGIHRNIELDINYDVVLCGLQYEHRVKAVEAMKNQGLRVFNALGVIYEKYVETYCHGKIAFSWSSKNDLPARFWEGLAMRRMVLTNRVPDLQELEFKEGTDYEGFSTIEEAVEKAQYYADPQHEAERFKIALNGWRKVQPHTYQARAKQILKVIQNL